MTLLEEIRAHREEILAIAAKRGVFHIRVFGSAARGEESPTSDIDLLIEMEDGRSYFDLGGFAVEVSELFSRQVDAATERMLNRFIREKILSEAVPL